MSAETLLAQAGLFSGEEPAPPTADDHEAPAAQQVADVIKADPRLTEAQKAALIAVYASMLRDDEDAAGLPERARGSGSPAMPSGSGPPGVPGLLQPGARSASRVWRHRRIGSRRWRPASAPGS